MSKRILVIDDKEDIRESFELSLEDSEYAVDTAESGQRGLEMIANRNYDLIFLDLKMPGMNGVDTLREIRKTDNKTPVYIITAFHSEFFDQLKDIQKEGIEFELLKKPIDSNQIFNITKGILGKPVNY